MFVVLTTQSNHVMTFSSIPCKGLHRLKAMMRNVKQPYDGAKALSLEAGFGRDIMRSETLPSFDFLIFNT